MVLRIIDTDFNNAFISPKIIDYFIDFTNIFSSSGLNHSNILIEKLKLFGIYEGKAITMKPTWLVNIKEFKAEY